MWWPRVMLSSPNCKLEKIILYLCEGFKFACNITVFEYNSVRDRWACRWLGRSPLMNWIHIFNSPCVDSPPGAQISKNARWTFAVSLVRQCTQYELTIKKFISGSWVHSKILFVWKDWALTKYLKKVSDTLVGGSARSKKPICVS